VAALGLTPPFNQVQHVSALNLRFEISAFKTNLSASNSGFCTADSAPLWQDFGLTQAHISQAGRFSTGRIKNF
jgi:hypothetical protein